MRLIAINRFTALLHACMCMYCICTAYLCICMCILDQIYTTI